MNILKGYRGAGVLFAALNIEGDTQVLLGQRLYSPFRGRWSIPGGRMEVWDKGDFRACAAREAFEETVGPTQCKANVGLFSAQIIRAPEHRLCIPLFFEFRTYLVVLNSIPTPLVWPNERLWHSEFQRYDWFKPSELPAPLHPNLKTAINQLLPRGR